MATAFPDIAPTGRSFTAPQWPTTQVKSRSGFTSNRLWGSRPANATLSLEFRHITDDQAASILAAWHAAKGSNDNLTLPLSIFTGANNTLKAWLDTSATGAGINWYFPPDGAPRLTSLAPNINNVQVSLSGELRLS